MKKAKWLVPMTLAGILLSGSVGVYAGAKLESIQAFKNHGIQVFVKGKAYTPVDTNGKTLAPITFEGTTYLPIRSIGESLNTSVLYDAVNNKVLIGSATADSDTYTEQKAVSSKTTTSPSASSNSSTTPSTASAGTSSSSPSTSTNNDDTLSVGVSAPVNVPPGPIDSLNDNPAPVTYNIGMTTGTIQSPYLSTDFPFPSDATKIKLVQQAVGGKKQLLLVYSTQADLQTVGNAYVSYFTSYNMNFGAVQIDTSGISIVGTVSDEFGVSIQGNPMSLRPGYNSVSVTLAEQ
ncbi:hypothetical protein ACE3MZ_21775 [Paenibacillus sp. WLX1005]|uniref:hypothetical protein n=1 Tax=unclassified Paenibacillus TaxID=185978 RepID=UPI0039844618